MLAEERNPKGQCGAGQWQPNPGSHLYAPRCARLTDVALPFVQMSDTPMPGNLDRLTMDDRGELLVDETPALPGPPLPDLAYYINNPDRVGDEPDGPIRLNGVISRARAHPSGNGGHGQITWRCTRNNTGGKRWMRAYFDWEQCLGAHDLPLTGAPALGQQVQFIMEARPDSEDGYMAVDVTGPSGTAVQLAPEPPAAKRRRGY